MQCWCNPSCARLVAGEMNFSSLSEYFARTPRAGLPYADEKAYGARLAGAIVKFEVEARHLLALSFHPAVVPFTKGEKALAIKRFGLAPELVHTVPNGERSRQQRHMQLACVISC